jgi:hypothetical protein
MGTLPILTWLKGILYQPSILRDRTYHCSDLVTLRGNKRFE